MSYTPRPLSEVVDVESEMINLGDVYPAEVDKGTPPSAEDFNTLVVRAKRALVSLMDLAEEYEHLYASFLVLQRRLRSSVSFYIARNRELMNTLGISTSGGPSRRNTLQEVRRLQLKAGEITDEQARGEIKPLACCRRCGSYLCDGDCYIPSLAVIGEVDEDFTKTRVVPTPDKDDPLGEKLS